MTLTRVIPFHWRWGCKNMAMSWQSVLPNCQISLCGVEQFEGGLQYMNEAYAMKKDVIGTADMKKELYGMRMPYHYSTKP